MQSSFGVETSETPQRAWQAIVARYQTPDLRRSLWQVANTFPLYFGLLYLMYLSLTYSYLLTLALALLAGGLLVRIAVILHDCGHGSFFRSQRVNNLLGIFCGLLAFVPYHQWRFAHAIHHATSGDLDRRPGVGDIMTLTVAEYLSRPWWKRLIYRVYRHPVFLLCIAPLLLMLVAQRMVIAPSGRRERYAVYYTNFALLAIIATMWLTIGLTTYLLIYLPVLAVASTVLCYLFYVQHQFEGVYWQRHDTWDYTTAALEGSSYLKLPKVLQWFTASLDLHHVHHLSPRIPNYNLQRCQDEHPVFHRATIITARSSVQSLRLNLSDEERGRLIRFGALKTLRKQGELPLKA